MSDEVKNTLYYAVVKGTNARLMMDPSDWKSPPIIFESADDMEASLRIIYSKDIEDALKRYVAMPIEEYYERFSYPVAELYARQMNIEMSRK